MTAGARAARESRSRHFALERQLEELLHVPVDVVPDSALGAAGEEALRPDLLAL